MKNIVEWAEDYQNTLKVARERAKDRFYQGIEEVPPYMNAVVVQSWLEDLSRAIIEDSKTHEQDETTNL